MMIPLQIRFRDKTDKLATLFEPTMSCRVVIVMPHQHKHQCRFFSVRIDIGVPGREIVVNCDQHEDVYVALRDGFETAKRQLTAYAHRLHGDTQSHPSEHLGGVARIFPDEGYGFIRRTDGDRLYFKY